MADIAILVAEEYERKVKNARRMRQDGAAGWRKLEINWGPSVSVIAGKVKNMINQENPELIRWILEPKSQIGLAASNGFFSA